MCSGRSLNICKQYIIDLHTVIAPFSPRLQQVIMDSIALIGYEGFKEVGTERFVGLLNNLHISIEIDVELLTSRVSAKHTRRVSVKVWVVGLCSSGVCVGQIQRSQQR